MAAVAVGIMSGVSGAVLTLLLHGVQRLAFGYSHSTFLVGLEHTPPWRRVVGTTLVGLLVSVGWWRLRSRGRVVVVKEALADATVRMPLRRTAYDALLQVVAVGGGASVGREAAPRQVGAALAGWLGPRLGLAPPERRLMLAAGAGAGLAAVYGVPVSGALLALLALGSLASATLVEVAVVAIASAAGTVVAWPVTGTRSLYAVPAVHLDPRVLVWAAVGAPVCVGAARLLDDLAHRAMDRAPTPSWRLPLLVTTAMTLVGVVAICAPALPGNGKGLVELALRPGSTSGWAFLVLLLLKVLLTGACLRCGIVGGLITPALAVGAALGASAALLGGSQAGADTAAYALVASSGTLAVSQRSALFAVALVWELTRMPWQLAAVCLGTALLARGLARLASGLRGRVGT